MYTQPVAEVTVSHALRNHMSDTNLSTKFRDRVCKKTPSEYLSPELPNIHLRRDIKSVSRNIVDKKQNSMVWGRERTIPTERPPLLGEVIADFCG
jgi:hypothetical protein